MRKIVWLILSSSLLAAKVTIASANSITRYQVDLNRCQRENDGKTLIGLRRWLQDGDEKILAVEPRTLQTEIIEARDVNCQKLNSETMLGLQGTRYFRFIEDQQKAKLEIVNAGWHRPSAQRQGNFLTVDLCPSRKPIEKGFFEKIFEEGAATSVQTDNTPTFLNVAISGKWIEHHQQELAWLVRSAKLSQINVLWLNHSYTHPYEKGIDLKNNFLLTPGIDFDFEVLKNEQVMIENNLVPSIFFRYPGLVANQGLINRLTDFGLIAVGADAWLAKGQKPKLGGIILVHGNGNESIGIKMFLKAFDSNEIFKPFLPMTQYK